MLRRKIGLLQKRRGEECKERRLPMTANILDDQEDQNFEKKKNIQKNVVYSEMSIASGFKTPGLFLPNET